MSTVSPWGTDRFGVSLSTKLEPFSTGIHGNDSACLYTRRRLNVWCCLPLLQSPALHDSVVYRICQFVWIVVSSRHKCFSTVSGKTLLYGRASWISTIPLHRLSVGILCTLLQFCLLWELDGLCILLGNLWLPFWIHREHLNHHWQNVCFWITKWCVIILHNFLFTLYFSNFSNRDNTGFFHPKPVEYHQAESQSSLQHCL